MEETESLLIKSNLLYSLSRFNTKIKFTPVMVEVLYIIVAFFFLSGQTKFSDVICDLIRLPQRSPNAIGTALKDFSKLGLIDYYRKGKGIIIELHIENDFLRTFLVRMFGIREYAFATSKESIILGFYPISNPQASLELLEEGIQIVNTQLTNQKVWLNWLEELKAYEKLAKETTSVTVQAEFNPILMFIDELSSAIETKQKQQTETLSVNDLTAIVSENVQDYQDLPPWLDEVVSTAYSSLRINEDDL
ncbi:MAG: hypothetical protein ACTSQX_07845 [Candidatus Heimdallarchaeota archaeon]